MDIHVISEDMSIPDKIPEMSRDKRLFARVLFGFVGLLVCRFLILIYLAFSVTKAMGEIRSGVAISEGNLLGKVATLDGLFLLASFFAICIIVLFFIWLYLAVSVRNKINPDTRRFTPVWAVIGFLIPGVNLILPMLIMMDLWAGSSLTTAGQPKKIMMHGIVFAVIWWLFYVFEAGLNLWNAHLRIVTEISVQNLPEFVSGVGFAALIGVVHGICLLLLVAGIEKQQQDAAASLK